MALKYCQGTSCHQYTTKDRLRGTKGNKTFQTRRRSNLYYGNGNFCSTRCQDDWLNEYVDRAIDHFGRTTEVKHLTEDNAWVKDYNWDSLGSDNRYYYFVNQITKEQRPITEEQYNDMDYELNIS